MYSQRCIDPLESVRLPANVMRISRITVQNFRSIQSLDFPLGNICALIGPNNAGTSNILLALQHVLGRDWVSVTTFEEG